MAKKEMSETGKEMLAFQEKLAAEYNYSPLGFNLFLGDVREKYLNALPGWCSLTGSPTPLFSLDGTQISTAYERVVTGDYGCFLEISPDHIIENNIHCKPGQEYRYTDERFAENVKYLWFTTKDRSDCKIYLQKKAVDYADYIPGCYYISPYEVYI